MDKQEMKLQQGRFLKGSKASATIEFAVLFILVLAALFTFRDYIVRGIQGNYKRMGESVSFHRQYNSYATISCRCDFAGSCDEEGNCEDARSCYDEMCFDGYGCEGFDEKCITDAKAMCFVDRCQPPSFNTALDE